MLLLELSFLWRYPPSSTSTSPNTISDNGLNLTSHLFCGIREWSFPALTFFVAKISSQLPPIIICQLLEPARAFREMTFWDYIFLLWFIKGGSCSDKLVFLFYFCTISRFLQLNWTHKALRYKRKYLKILCLRGYNNWQGFSQSCSFLNHAFWGIFFMKLANICKVIIIIVKVEI